MADACAFGIAEVLWSCLAHGRPADRALNRFLRENRQLGSRDRRLLSETLFALLRWWGWVRRLAPSAFVRAISRDKERGRDAPALEPREWAPAFLAAHLLDCGHLPAAAWIWRRQASIHDRDLQQLPTSRQPHLWNRCLNPFFREGTKPAFRLRELIPAWSLRELSAACAADPLIEWLQKRPPVWLRAQRAAPERLRRMLADAGITLRPPGPLPGAVAIEPPRINLRTLEGFKKGWFEIQDAASQCVGLICAPRPGQRWWDACAGAGGKTLHLGTLMESRGSLTASDIRVYKLDDMKKRARRANLSNIRIREWKGKALPRSAARYDGVLVDAPCTCSGTWRRNPDGRWTTTRAEVAEFAALQQDLLTHASSVVVPGGVLVYATCSMFERENEAVVRAFLEAHPEFRLDPFANPLNGESTDGTLQIRPWDCDCDAMYVARMVRNETNSDEEPQENRRPSCATS